MFDVISGKCSTNCGEDEMQLKICANNATLVVQNAQTIFKINVKIAYKRKLE